MCDLLGSLPVAAFEKIIMKPRVLFYDQLSKEILISVHCGAHDRQRYEEQNNVYNHVQERDQRHLGFSFHPPARPTDVTGFVILHSDHVELTNQSLILPVQKKDQA